MPELLPPQLVVNCRMMFLSYLPAEPAAIDRALPADLGLTPVESRAAVLVHYVVDRDEQTSGFGAYSLSYICFDVVGHDADAETPGRWFSHYFISSPRVRDYAIERGIPATDGVTTLEFEGDILVATATVDGQPMIRSRARTTGEVGEITGGQLMVLSALDGRVMRNRHHGARQGLRDAIDRVPGPGSPDPPLPPHGAAGPGLRLPRAARVVLLSRRYRGRLTGLPVRQSAGQRPRHGLASSYAEAARNTRRSSKLRPTIWIPVGTPVLLQKPLGTLITGHSPTMLNG